MSTAPHLSLGARRLLAAAAVAVAATGCAGGSHDGGSKVGPAPGEHGSPPANGPIVYERYVGAREDNRTAQLYMRTPEGSIRRLTPVRGGAFAPTLAPDGSRIAFENGSAGARHRILSMKADGSDLRPVAGGCTSANRCFADVFPAYSPDGRRISFERIYGPLVRHPDTGPGSYIDVAPRVDLMVSRADGGAPRMLKRWGSDPQPWNGAPRWSPDGTHVVLPIGTLKAPNKHTAVGTALFVLDIANGGQRRITPWELGAAAPSWSPDGRRIVFNSEGGHSRSIYVVRPDGTGLALLVKGNARAGDIGDTIAPAWSPDGRQITFGGDSHPCHSLHRGGCRNAPGSLDLYVMNADGSRARRLTSAPQFEGRPAWGRAR
jgi:Tol biopolymer transport system component